MKNTNWKSWLIAACIVIAFAIAVPVLFFHSRTREVACTEEAKRCSDGSYVVRTGPDCEFESCPSDELWKTRTDAEQGITFQYPEHLLAQYISAQVWPPEITLASGVFSCAETPQEVSGTLERVYRYTVDDRVYCVDVTSEGAAGSVFSSYVYTTHWDEELISIRFVLQYPNCMNYDDPQQQICASERETFALDELVDRIARSVTLSK